MSDLEKRARKLLAGVYRETYPGLPEENIQALTEFEGVAFRAVVRALTPSTPGTREEGLEEAARVAGDWNRNPRTGTPHETSVNIAEAIRALKQTDPTGREG